MTALPLIAPEVGPPIENGACGLLAVTAAVASIWTLRATVPVTEGSTPRDRVIHGGTTDELEVEEVKPALQACLGDLQRLHAGLAVELQARIQLRDVEERGAEQGHDEHQHEPHHEGAASLVAERPRHPSPERLARQCRLPPVTSVTPNVSGRLVPSLSVKVILAPGTVAHDWFATEHTEKASHVPPAAVQGVTGESDQGVHVDPGAHAADSATRDPSSRLATGVQGSVDA